MLILRELQLNNYLSHEDTKIKFSPNEKLLIDGKSGTGKSSIVEAIIWALYGRGRSDNNRGLIKSGKASARVILTMEDDKVIYRIERNITKAGKSTLKITSGKTLKELKPIKVTGFKLLQSFLEKELLKSSYLLFINSIAYPQDNVENFVKQTAAKRKEIILEIVNASVYDEYYAKTKDKLNETESEKNTLNGIIEALSQVDEDDQKEIDNIPNLKNNLKKNKKEIKDMEEKRDSIVKDIGDKEEAVKENEEKKEELADAQKELDAVNEEITDLNKRYVETNSLNINEERKKYEDLDAKKNKLHEQQIIASNRATWANEMLKLQGAEPSAREFDSEKKEINKQIIDLLNKKIDLCPELNKVCPLISRERDERVKELENRLKQVNIEQENYVQLYDSYHKKVKELGEEPPLPLTPDVISKMTAEVDKLEEIKSEIEVKVAEKENTLRTIAEKVEEKNIKKANITKEIESIKKEIKTDLVDITPLRNGLDNIEKTLSGLRDDENMTSSNLAIAESIKRRYEKNAIQIKKKKEELKKFTDIIKSLELLKEAFSPTGIKAIIIDYVIPRLEDRINEILKLLSDFTIRLDTQRDGTKEGIIKEGLFISIFNESGEEFDFDNYSGGQKLKIIVAISESLAALQNIGFRIFDEVFIGLDTESTTGFSGVITKLNEQFNQMLCISHLQEIKDEFDNKLTITNNNGNSVVKTNG